LTSKELADLDARVRELRAETAAMEAGAQARAEIKDLRARQEALGEKRLMR